MIPITVIMTVKNEAVNLPHSLPVLVKNFEQVIVVDSNSTDDTQAIAAQSGATVYNFTWNGQYPKKRQWCLDSLPIKHDWILMIDADEVVTDDFLAELRSLDFSADGYFVSSRMVWKGTALKYGMKNIKLCLFKKSVFHFPVVDDLDIDGMGEIEGHYQPVASAKGAVLKLSCLHEPLLHHDRKNNWHERHDGYVRWETDMTRRNAWPQDPVVWRQAVKSLIRCSYLRPVVIFLYGYVWKLGFLDGAVGLDYALSRARYTARIVRAIRQTSVRR